MVEISDHKRMEFSGILNALPLAYVKLTIIRDSNHQVVDFSFTEINERLCEVSGHHYEELINRRFSEVFPQLKSFFNERLHINQSKLIPGSSFKEEVFIKYQNKWFDLHVNVPEHNCLIILLSDCTSRKLLENELKLNESKFKSLYEDSPIGLCLSSLEGTLISANRALLNIFSLPNLKALADSNILPEISSDLNIDHQGLTWYQQTDNFHEYSVKLQDGRLVYVRERSQIIHDSTGNPLFIERMIEDITERKIAKLQITKLNHLYLELGIDIVKNIQTILKKACEIVNGSFSFFNYMDEDGKSLKTWSLDNINPELKLVNGAEGHICFEKIIKGDKKPVIIEDLNNTEFKHSDPNVLKSGFRAYLGIPVVIESKTIGSLCVIDKLPRGFTDIEINIIGTLAKVLALELQRSEIEGNLKLARDEAKKANEAKTQFLANMSHEIRTPLNGIIGFAEMLASQEKDQKKAGILNIIENSGYQLLQIVNDIFDYSRLEHGKIMIKSESFILDEVIKETLTFFSKAAEDKGLQFIVNLDDITIKHLSGDSYKLKQILINVISNAIKFTEGGSVMVIAESYVRNEDAVVTITVEDTGIGISDDQLGKIFDEFKQLEYYLTKKIKGTGLGLTITKKLIDLMHGTIEVESEQGKGSRFIIKIPFKSGPGLNNEKKEEFMKNTETGNAAGDRKIKILLAEDNEANQFLIKAITKSQNWEITVVDNGAQAVEKYQSEKFDIILMDVQMPVMNGYEATKIIRGMEQEKGIHTPIIALTAYAMKSDKDVCIESGMDDYISKPFKRQQFIESINDALNNKFNIASK